MKSLAELKKIKEEEDAKKQVELINRMTEEIKADMHETVKAELKEKIDIISESKKDIIAECRNLNNQLLAVNNRLAELEKKYKDVKTEKKTILNNQNLIANQITTYPIEVKFDCVNYLFPGLYTLNCVIYNNASYIYYPFYITIEIVDKPTEEKGKSNKN